ncbi:MAG: Crp/Fnr family transcriptional regulator [Gammaproteobacteria bacterium]|nr:Crp/Fnr family transcriptional regulator [Gammaproteobacteria bacterium]MBU1444466.1 Crp/Fnr family transcriptional regulator [Gammaproteobacteria bacterium]MBU2407291.1 Crp/Fnr family transcriptional regulator [Gammaproteobacteria bacterium]
MPSTSASVQAQPPDFDALPPALRQLAARGVQRRFRTDAVLIEEGETGDTIFIVLSGRLRAFVSDSRGREVTMAIHGPGEYVGEMSLDGSPRSASVQAVEPSLCAVVTRQTLLQHIASDPEFALSLIVKLIGRARLATESARSMALLDVYGRLKRLLESRAQTLEDGTRRIEERLTHQAIASEIGCSREMVSRLMKDLEGGGYVAVGGRRIMLVRDLPARW